METTSSEEINKCRYIAFFDLDHTLTGAVSGTDLARRALKKGMMRITDLLHALYLSAGYRLGLKDPVKAVSEMTGWVKDVPEKDFINLCDEVFNDVIKPAFFNEAQQEVDMHRNRKARTVILSSSLSPICSKAATWFGIDDVICTELEVSEGLLTGRPVGKICFGEEKLVRLWEYCEKNNSKPSECWYYADALADLPALQSVGHPVCVNPENRLRRMALRNHWEIRHWKSS